VHDHVADLVRGPDVDQVHLCAVEVQDVAVVEERGRENQLDPVEVEVLVQLLRDCQNHGVITGWRNGPHALTYRQTERTFGLVTGALAKNEPDGQPSRALQAFCDDLLDASTMSSRPACARLCVLGFPLAT
jgi:hypothetical protein